jgi:hypothetical protein
VRCNIIEMRSVLGVFFISPLSTGRAREALGSDTRGRSAFRAFGWARRGDGHLRHAKMAAAMCLSWGSPAAIIKHRPVTKRPNAIHLGSMRTSSWPHRLH